MNASDAYSASNQVGATGALYAGLAASVVAEFASGEGFGVGSLAAQFLQVGAPTMFGAAVATALHPITLDKPDNMTLVKHGALSGGSAAVLLMASGAMPVALDIQTLGFIALIGGAVVGGEMLAKVYA